MGTERNRELLEAYEATHYTIGKEMIIRIGESCPPLDEFLLKHRSDAAAYLTAWNPWSEIQSPEANAIANERLAKELNSLPEVVHVLNGIGMDASGKWSGEESFLIIGIHFKQAMELAERYGQNAFVFYRRGSEAELIVTSQFGKSAYIESQFITPPQAKPFKMGNSDPTKQDGQNGDEVQ